MAGEDPVAKLGDREESDEAELNEALEEMLAAICQATDTSDPSRVLHMAFRLLPSKNVSIANGIEIFVILGWVGSSDALTFDRDSKINILTKVVGNKQLL